MYTQAQNFVDLSADKYALHLLVRRANSMALWVETPSNTNLDNPQATVYGFGDGSALSVLGEVFTVEQN